MLFTKRISGHIEHEAIESRWEESVISPEQIASQQYCPRQRFLSYDNDGGVELTHISVKDALNQTVKPALSRLLASKALSIEHHASDVKAAYAAMVQKGGGLALEPAEDAGYVWEEQQVLAEAIIRAAGTVLVKDFAHIKNVTEPETRDIHLSDSLSIQTRPDLLLEYENGRCGLFWHIVSSKERPSVWPLRHQVVSSVLAFDLELVEIRYVRKGYRRQAFGRFVQTCDLIRAEPKSQVPPRVRQITSACTRQVLENHFSLDWAPVDVNNAKLSGYKFTKGSIDLVQMISPSETQAWKAQVLAQEKQVAACLRTVKDIDQDNRRAAIDAFFPQYRHSCQFCAFRPACDQALTDNLAESGIYRRRHAVIKSFLTRSSSSS